MRLPYMVGLACWLFACGGSESASIEGLEGGPVNPGAAGSNQGSAGMGQGTGSAGSTGSSSGAGGDRSGSGGAGVGQAGGSGSAAGASPGEGGARMSDASTGSGGESTGVRDASADRKLPDATTGPGKGCEASPGQDQMMCGKQKLPHYYRCVVPYDLPTACIQVLVGNATDGFCCE